MVSIVTTSGHYAGPKVISCKQKIITSQRKHHQHRTNHKEKSVDVSFRVDLAPGPPSLHAILDHGWRFRLGCSSVFKNKQNNWIGNLGWCKHWELFFHLCVFFSPCFLLKLEGSGFSYFCWGGKVLVLFLQVHWTEGFAGERTYLSSFFDNIQQLVCQTEDRCTVSNISSSILYFYTTKDISLIQPS